MAEGNIAGRIVTIIHCQFTGEPLLQIWQDLKSHQPSDGRRHQFRDDERDQHAHVLRKKTNGDESIADLDPRRSITVRATRRDGWQKCRFTHGGEDALISA